MSRPTRSGSYFLGEDGPQWDPVAPVKRAQPAVPRASSARLRVGLPEPASGDPRESPGQTRLGAAPRGAAGRGCRPGCPGAAPVRSLCGRGPSGEGRARPQRTRAPASAAPMSCSPPGQEASDAGGLCYSVGERGGGRCLEGAGSKYLFQKRTPFAQEQVRLV